MAKLKPLREQVVVVMGASTGIGRLTALELGKRGARVVASARDAVALESLAREIRAAGGQAVAVPADVAKSDEVVAVAQLAEGEFSRIDTWVNCAAVSTYAPFERLTPDELKQIVEVDLLGYGYGALAALPALRRAGGGALINVASVESRVALPLHSAYAAAKHGVLGLADALRIELLHDRAPISVTSILPASVDTPFFDHAGTKLGVKPRGIPPVYPPEKVVGAILYAAENPVRELVVGEAGRALIAMRILAPGLTERLLARAGWQMQHTDEPRGDAASEDLYGPAVTGDARVHQEPEARVHAVRKPSFYARHPRVGAFAALGGLVALWRGVVRARA